MTAGLNLQQRKHTPLVLVETANLPEEKWLSYRRRGIGGSDVAAIMGISPFRTARDLYYDKLNIAPIEEDKGNWVALAIGHLLEDLVAKIFEVKTGYPVYQIKKMFYHPDHPFMLADVDYFTTLPDGSTALVEIKTTNYNAQNHWWDDGNEIVPVYYETQGRHYMAVMDIDRIFYCCLYGNNENDSSTVLPLLKKFIISNATETVTIAATVEIRIIWLYTSCMISLAFVHTSVAANTGWQYITDSAMQRTVHCASPTAENRR